MSCTSGDEWVDLGLSNSIEIENFYQENLKDPLKQRRNDYNKRILIDEIRY